MSDLVVETHGDGPPVVLVPTALGNRGQWEHVAADLATDHQVIVYEPRNHGTSPIADADYHDWEDAVEVLASVGVGRAVWVGGSNGGRIAVETAVMAPEIVAGLVLLAPARRDVGWEGSPEVAGRYEQQARLLASGDVEAAAAIDQDVFLVGDGRRREDVEPWLLAHTWPWFLAASERERARAGRGVSRDLDPPLHERLSEVRVPTLVVVGEHDQPRMRISARRYADELPDARLVQLAGVSHLPAVEAPQETTRLLRGHLARLGW